MHLSITAGFSQSQINNNNKSPQQQLRHPRQASASMVKNTLKNKSTDMNTPPPPPPPATCSSLRALHHSDPPPHQFSSLCGREQREKVFLKQSSAGIWVIGSTLIFFREFSLKDLKDKSLFYPNPRPRSDED